MYQALFPTFQDSHGNDAKATHKTNFHSEFVVALNMTDCSKIQSQWLLDHLSCYFWSLPKAFFTSVLIEIACLHVSTMARHMTFNTTVQYCNGSRVTSCNTVVSRKRAHGRCTLHWAQNGGWADIRGSNIHRRRKMLKVGVGGLRYNRMKILWPRPLSLKDHCGKSFWMKKWMVSRLEQTL